MTVEASDERFNHIDKIQKRKPTYIYIFLISFIFIILIALYSYHQLIRLITNNAWVTHTYQVIEATDNVLYDIADIEAHQRGYLITGDNNFINDKNLIPNIYKNLSLLESLTVDNPEEGDRIKKLKAVVNNRLAVLNRVIGEKNKNQLNSPQGLTLFHQGQGFSDQIKLLGQEIKATELLLLNTRNSTALTSAHITDIVIVATYILSISFLLLAFILASRELALSIRLDQKRRNAESRLRSIIEGANDKIAALDINYKFIIFNDAYSQDFKKIFGKSIAIGMTLDEALSFHPEDKNKLVEAWKASLQGREYIRNFEFKADNEKNIYEITSSSIKNDEGSLVGAVHIMRNITKRLRDQEELLIAYKKLDVGMHSLQDKNEQISLLVEMSDIMLGCDSQQEVGHVVAKYCQKILKSKNGFLYMMHPSRNYLEILTQWGGFPKQESSFIPDDCWAIRLGHVYVTGRSNTELVCRHIKTPNDRFTYICIPLMAQNDIYGLLFLAASSSEQWPSLENTSLLMKAFAELTASSFANIRLRENLLHQSMRDPLTGLYNRRFLEDFLFKQINQAERTNKIIAVSMLDLDHFKKINDTFGHEAGDVVLKEVGLILQKNIRSGDLAARYGGEEFIVVFYNADMESVKNRAEHLREEISRIRMKYGAQQLPLITISIGMAFFPGNGKTQFELIEAADKALYSAKNAGRNRVVISF